MKKIIIDCNFGGQQAPFSFYIGKPQLTNHPIQFQSDWLGKNRGGSVPGDVIKSLQDIFDLAQKNNVSFEELCIYALEGNSDDNGGNDA